MDRHKFVDAEQADIISQLSQDETGKRQYYRPVYSIHKWWARRPGSLFRSIILLTQQRDRKLFESLSDGSISPQSEYFQTHDLSDVIVLDPFMGGGTTLVEANRLGAKVIGCDINPVSYWIVRESLKPIDLEKLDFYFHQVEQNAGEKIKSLYKTHCIHCCQTADGLYAFWVRYIECPHCHQKVHLYKRTLLNEGLSRNKPISDSNPATVFCPACFNLCYWDGKQDCTCSDCGHSFEPRLGTYKQGLYSCPHCNASSIPLLATLQSGQTLKERLIAIEYWCNTCRRRLYKSPDSHDLSLLQTIQDTVEDSRDALLFPRQKILEGDSSVRWRLHQYTHYHQVFSPRQILAFNYLLEAILSIPEEEYRNALITVFSNSLEYNNMMTPYNYPHRKLHHLFNYHALPLTTTPVENAVWGVGDEGAGTFVNCYNRYRLAKEYCQSPFDRFKDRCGRVHTVSSKELVSANFVDNFEQLKTTDRGALLLCGDSATLPAIPDRSVDLVITDPPYFDNVHYSELSNFFYVWLSKLIDHPYFASEHVPTDNEAIVNEKMEKGEAEYQNLLTNVFREAHRVLKEDGKLIFTFHHTKWRAWWTLHCAITQSGFRVVDTFPVMSEYRVNPHIRNKQSLDMDLVLICEKVRATYRPLSTHPSDIIQRVEQELGEGTIHIENKYFLHCMGELLKTASASAETVNYDWFSDCLSYFESHIKQTTNGQKTSPPKTTRKELGQIPLFEMK